MPHSDQALFSSHQIFGCPVNELLRSVIPEFTVLYDFDHPGVVEWVIFETKTQNSKRLGVQTTTHTKHKKQEKTTYYNVYE